MPGYSSASEVSRHPLPMRKIIKALDSLALYWLYENKDDQEGCSIPVSLCKSQTIKRTLKASVL